MKPNPIRPVVIDGGIGEGGGQILRTSLALAAATSRPVRIVNIRAGRPRPGLGAQHLTGLRALTEICDAKVSGDELGSEELTFEPRSAPRPGEYRFDIAEARLGGNTGSATLLLHTILIPLALAPGRSVVTVRGGTHIPFSPSYDHMSQVWKRTLSKMGREFSFELIKIGWAPTGHGEIRVQVEGQGADPLGPFVCKTRGSLAKITGRAIGSRQPAGYEEKCSAAAAKIAQEQGIRTELEALRLPADGRGFGLFVVSEYEKSLAGFDSLGAATKTPLEAARAALATWQAFDQSGATTDVHLGDQLLLPAALAREASLYSVEKISSHLLTNAAVIQRFGLARILIEGKKGLRGYVVVRPQTAKRTQAA